MGIAKEKFPFCRAQNLFIDNIIYYYFICVTHTNETLLTMEEYEIIKVILKRVNGMKRIEFSREKIQNFLSE